MALAENPIDDYLARLPVETEETRLLRTFPWVLDVGRQDPEALIRDLREEAPRLAELPRRPVFSLLTPMYNTPPRLLREVERRCLLDAAECMRSLRRLRGVKQRDVERSVVDRAGELALRGQMASEPSGAGREHVERTRCSNAANLLDRACEHRVDHLALGNEHHVRVMRARTKRHLTSEAECATRRQVVIERDPHRPSRPMTVRTVRATMRASSAKL